MSNDLFIHQISFIVTTFFIATTICRVDRPAVSATHRLFSDGTNSRFGQAAIKGREREGKAPNVNLVRVSMFSLPLPLLWEAEKPNAFFPSLNKQGNSSSPHD